MTTARAFPALLVVVMIAILGAIAFGVVGLHSQTRATEIQNERILTATEAIEVATEEIRAQSRLNLRLIRIAGDRVKLLLTRTRQLEDFIREQGLEPPPLTKAETAEITGGGKDGGGDGKDDEDDDPPPPPAPPPAPSPQPSCTVFNPLTGGCIVP